MKKMKMDWNHVAQAAYDSVIITAALMFTSSTLTATACQIGVDILPPNIHEATCRVSDMDTNGMALKR